MSFCLFSSPRGLPFALLVLGLLVTPAHAQRGMDEADAAEDDEETEDESKPVAGFAPPGISVHRATDKQKKSAQELFLEGDKDFDVQNYEEALGHFTASYSTVASPNSRLMIARCLLEIGRLDEAYDEYSGVINDAKGNDDYETTASAARKEREALRHRLAWLSVKMGDVPAGSRLIIGGRERTAESLEEPIAVTPGQMAVRATTEDGRVAEATVHLAAGRAADVKLQLGQTITVGDPPPAKENAKARSVPERAETSAPPPPPERANLKPYAYAAAGVGVLGLSGFAAFGILSANRYKALEDDCTDGICPPASQDDIDAGKQMQLLANIGLGVGVVGAAAAVTLFVLDGKKQRPVDVRVGYNNVMVRGAF